VFSWDAHKALGNLRKHGVSFEEAATVFSDPEGLDWDDFEHSLQSGDRPGSVFLFQDGFFLWFTRFGG
jgi:uncharacterized DUF497 family protein